MHDPRRATILNGLLQRFVASNIRFSRRIERRLPQARHNLQTEFERVLGEIVGAASDPMLAVDIGAGRRSHVGRVRPPGSQVRVVAVDVSADELALNRDADECVVADVTERLPFADASVDLLVARTVLEHLRDTERLVAAAARVLTPGGLFVAVFPNRYALTSILNRVIPQRLARWLLHALVPGSEGSLGFPAHYDRTTMKGMKEMLAGHGFEIVRVDTTYYDAPYFAFFVPLYLLVAAFELVVYTFGIGRFAATILLVARRTHEVQAPGGSELDRAES